MNGPSDASGPEALRDRVIGLGERSGRKSHYAALQRSLRALEEKDRLIRKAYSDVIAAVTGGRLVILGRDEMDKEWLVPNSEDHELNDPSQLAKARHTVRDAVGGFEGLDDLLLAFSEGATNMLKHASGGIYRVRRDDRRVRVLLSDSGPGIDFHQLPEATLTAGFSTAQTLGMGFTLMLDLTDRLVMCTDQGGTTLVLEKDLRTAERGGGAERA